MAFVCVILKPCSASRAAPACTSFSNSTKAISWRPGTKRTSLNPGNLCKKPHGWFPYELTSEDTLKKHGAKMLLTGWRAWTAWVRSSPRASWWGREYDWEDFRKPAAEKWHKLMLLIKSSGLHNVSDSNHDLPAEASVLASGQASFHQVGWHQGASGQVPFPGAASCSVEACKEAGLAYASFEEPGSFQAFPKHLNTGVTRNHEC